MAQSVFESLLHGRVLQVSPTDAVHNVPVECELMAQDMACGSILETEQDVLAFKVKGQRKCELLPGRFRVDPVLKNDDLGRVLQHALVHLWDRYVLYLGSNLLIYLSLHHLFKVVVVVSVDLFHRAALSNRFFVWLRWRRCLLKDSLRCEVHLSDHTPR